MRKYLFIGGPRNGEAVALKSPVIRLELPWPDVLARSFRRGDLPEWRGAFAVYLPHLWRRLEGNNLDIGIRPGEPDYFRYTDWDLYFWDGIPQEKMKRLAERWTQGETTAEGAAKKHSVGRLIKEMSVARGFFSMPELARGLDPKPIEIDPPHPIRTEAGYNAWLGSQLKASDDHDHETIPSHIATLLRIDAGREVGTRPFLALVARALRVSAREFEACPDYPAE